MMVWCDDPIHKVDSMKNILITGADGQLGRDCQDVLSAGYQVTAVDIGQLDIADARAVKKAVNRFKPDILINCAAFTRVDDCENQFTEAWEANSEGPANLARASAASGTRLVHISTDYVFDGKKPVPEAYTETDAPNPLSVYGSTKLAGEERVLEACADALVLRTAWLYGDGGKNFIRSILGRLVNEPQTRLTIVNDQYGSPTWSRRLALQIERLLKTRARGLYHATAEGYCTWYELAREMCEMTGLSGRIDPCTTADYPTPAVRPQNSILENKRLKSETLNQMADWREDLRGFLSAHGEALFAELGQKSGEGAS